MSISTVLFQLLIIIHYTCGLPSPSAVRLTSLPSSVSTANKGGEGGQGRMEKEKKPLTFQTQM